VCVSTGAAAEQLGMKVNFFSGHVSRCESEVCMCVFACPYKFVSVNV